MKRLIALAALLCAASACTPTTDNANAGNANANANAMPSATATPAGVSQADIETKEHQVWDAIKAKNWDAFGGMLSDDFTLVTDDGLMNKAQTVDGLKKYDLTDYTFSDVRFMKVDDDLAVLVYTSTEKSTFDGKPGPSKPLHNSSAWVRRAGQWIAAFHQETESMEAPAGGGAGANSNTAANTNANANANSNTSANANSNSNTSPANTNAAASATPEATDAVSKEKKVWEELKAKDYDAFASDLADNAIEVEPDGVYDKAGSVAGVKKIDFSKFTLSDWKETKLDADASLVTYVVTGPMAGHTVTERHSTIWSKRGQKWYAVLHQGTPQASH